MPSIALTKGLRAVVDECDLDRLSCYKWFASCGGRYACRSASNSRGGVVLMHRHILAPDPGLVVDHVNGDGLDNRRANIRVCTQSQNMANRAHNTGKMLPKGVSYDAAREMFIAHITIDGRQIFLGRFLFAPYAKAAYDAAAVRLFGDFARKDS